LGIEYWLLISICSMWLTCLGGKPWCASLVCIFVYAITFISTIRYSYASLVFTVIPVIMQVGWRSRLIVMNRHLMLLCLHLRMLLFAARYSFWNIKASLSTVPVSNCLWHY
jgi:hypothetical protein